ncbi:MAG: hypothetical protein AAGB35_03670 [Pseudomonadota bacterium]
MHNPSTWIYLPIVAVVFALLALGISGGTGSDSAANSTLAVFWFLPLIVWLSQESFHQLKKSNYSKLTKYFLVLIWLIPSIPLSIMSLYGILLLAETGFGIFF